MAQTVIGVFDSYDRANETSAALVYAGIHIEHIEVHARAATTSHELAPREPGSTDAEADAHAHPERSVLEKIEHFFANMFGPDDRSEETGHYHEAMRRGGALVIVEVADEAQLQTATTVLQRAGAIDIEQQAEHWEADGHTGFDRAAVPFTIDEAEAERRAFARAQAERAANGREAGNRAVRVYSRDR